MKTHACFLAAIALAGCSGGGGQQDAYTSLYTSAGCTDATQSFLKTYAGSFADMGMTTSMTIGADGAFSLTENRQVGGTVAGVPNPTVCTYVNQGKIVAVYSVAGSMQCATLAYDPDSQATSVMVYSIDQVTITPPVSANCQTWADWANMQASGGYLEYSVPLVLYDANSFQFQDNGNGPMAGEKMVRK